MRNDERNPMEVVSTESRLPVDSTFLLDSATNVEKVRATGLLTDAI